MKRPAPVAARKPLADLAGRRKLEGANTVPEPLRRKEPAVMSSVASLAGSIHLGMDTSKKTIMVATLMPGEQIPVTERIANEEAAVRRFIARLGDPSQLRACYEAGPGGYDLYWLLTSMGVACEVVAPSLIPKGGSDKVKTDRRDACRQARLHRAGELTPVRVPTRAEEAVRDLVRVRAGLLADRKRAQQRLTAVLMRHGCIWCHGSYWTGAHRAWIAAQRFTEPALTAAIAHYRAALDTREAELAAIEAELAPWAHREPLAGPVARLGCYRGIAELGALTLHRRSPTGGGSPPPARSCPIPGWSPPSTPPASGPAAATSPRPGPNRSAPR